MTDGERASSAVSFLDSMRLEIERLMRCGDAAKETKRVRSTEEVEAVYRKIRDISQSGEMSTRQACLKLNVHQCAYSKYAAKMGWHSTRPKARPLDLSEADIERIDALRAEGVSWAKIGKEFNRAPQVIGNKYRYIKSQKEAEKK